MLDRLTSNLVKNDDGTVDLLIKYKGSELSYFENIKSPEDDLYWIPWMIREAYKIGRYDERESLGVKD